MNGLKFAAGCALFLGALAAAASGQSVAAAPMSNVSASSGASASKTAFLVYEAQSNSRYNQLDVVNEIGTILAKSHTRLSAAERSNLYTALSAVAMAGTGVPAISGTSITNDFPLIRMKACREIGILGGKRAQVILLRVLRLDTAPVVLSEAAYQLGRLKRDPGNSVSNAIVAALARSVPTNGEGIFAYQALVTLGELAKVNKGKPDPSVYSAIAEVARMGYDPRVNAEAATALRSVMSYG